jgi:hypothetical protein
MPSWLSYLLGRTTEVAQPKAKPEPKFYYRTGMGDKYDESKAVEAAKRARRREVQQRKLAAKQATPKRRKTAALYVMPIRKAGKS